MTISPEAREALHAKIKDHRWTGGVNSDGYPKVKIEGKSHLASHVLLEALGRPVPSGKVVMHKDNDPKNMDPKNMVIGTQQQNLKQMRDEGRDRPRGVPQEPDVKTAAPYLYWLGFSKWASGGSGGFIDSLDQAGAAPFLKAYQNLPGQTRHLVDSLGKQYNMPGFGAYQTLAQDASYRGAQNFDALVNMHARNAGIRRNPGIDLAPELPANAVKEIRTTPPPLPPPKSTPQVPTAPAPAPVPPKPLSTMDQLNQAIASRLAPTSTPPPRPATPRPTQVARTPVPRAPTQAPTPLGDDVLFGVAGPPRPRAIPQVPTAPRTPTPTPTLPSAVAKSPLGIPKKLPFR